MVSAHMPEIFKILRFIGSDSTELLARSDKLDGSEHIDTWPARAKED